MTEKDTRPTYKPTVNDQALIELIERAHPLTLDTFASAIRYALKYTTSTDPAVIAITQEEDTMDEYTKTYDDGKTVFVTAHLVGFEGGHPSNVDYYRDERGYGCGNDDECVADQYHANFTD